MDKSKVMSRATKEAKGVADLISYENKLKATSGSTKCSKGVVISHTLQMNPRSLSCTSAGHWAERADSRKNLFKKPARGDTLR